MASLANCNEWIFFTQHWIEYNQTTSHQRRIQFKLLQNNSCIKNNLINIYKVLLANPGNGGYYVSGTYYESESTPDVQSTDAFLLEVDEDFNTINELILAGSGDDNGSQITLNSQGRPVWLVQSNSTDGDFEEAGASNTDGRFKIYSVTF